MDIFIEVIRGILVGLAGIILGMSFQVFTAYAARARKLGADPRALLPRHVAMISASYCLLILVSGGTQLEYLIDDIPPTWRLLIVPPAYLLGVWALRTIMLDLAVRAESPRRRAGDP